MFTEYTDVHPFLKNDKFFGDRDCHYIIRHATGDELSALTGTVYNSKWPINGFKDVYNYNHRYGINDLKAPPEKDTDILDDEVELEKPVVGCILGKDGKFYSSCALARKKSGAAAAVVVYLGDEPVETDTEYTGLAIAIEKLFRVKWIEYSTETDCGLTYTNNMKGLKDCLDGISNTQYLVNGCNGKGHNHPAAQACANFKPKVGEEGLQTYDFSEWFLPAGGQWILAYKGLGMTWEEESGPKNVNSNQILAEREKAKRLLEKAEVQFATYAQAAWTSTPSKTMYANAFAFQYNYLVPDQLITAEMPVMPFIAFKKK